MSKLLFVNDLPEGNTRSQHCRSHAVRISNLRRKQRRSPALPRHSRLITLYHTELNPHSEYELQDDEANPSKDQLPIWMQPALLSYLNETYQDDLASHVSNLFDYCTFLQRWREV